MYHVGSGPRNLVVWKTHANEDLRYLAPAEIRLAVLEDHMGQRPPRAPGRRVDIEGASLAQDVGGEGEALEPTPGRHRSHLGRWLGPVGRTGSPGAGNRAFTSKFSW